MTARSVSAAGAEARARSCGGAPSTKC